VQREKDSEARCGRRSMVVRYRQRRDRRGALLTRGSDRVAARSALALPAYKALSSAEQNDHPARYSPHRSTSLRSRTGASRHVMELRGAARSRRRGRHIGPAHAFWCHILAICMAIIAASAGAIVHLSRRQHGEAAAVAAGTFALLLYNMVSSRVGRRGGPSNH
jgi:hypothetical protein